MTIFYRPSSKSHQTLPDDKLYKTHSNATIPYVLEWSYDFTRIFEISMASSS